MDNNNKFGLQHGWKFMIVCVLLLPNRLITSAILTEGQSENVTQSTELAKREIAQIAQRREHSFNADGSVNYHGSGSGHDSGDLVPPLGGGNLNSGGLSDSYGAPIPSDSYGPPKGTFDSFPPGDSYGPPPRDTYGPPAPKPVYGPPKSKPSGRPPKASYGPPKMYITVPEFSYEPPKSQKPKFSRPRPTYGPPKPSFSQGTLLTPVPSSLYGPPKPSITYGTPLSPSSSYGLPSKPSSGGPPTPPEIKYDGWKPIPGLVSKPPSSHGAPSGSGDLSPPVEAHGNSGGSFFTGPSASYDLTSTSFGPSTSYGPPSKPSSSYGPPSFFSSGPSAFVASKPSNSYGPPSLSSPPKPSYGPPSKPSLSFSSLFSSPSSSYGPPKPNLSFSRPSSSFSPPRKPSPPKVSFGGPLGPSISLSPPSSSLSSSYGRPKPPTLSYGPPKPPSLSFGSSKPSSSYGPPKPPGSSYGLPKPPGIAFASLKPPSPAYGPPKPPSSSYGPPKPPGITFGSLKPLSSSYGPPKPPSSSYGPPKPPSSSYGPPKPPSSSYGPPKPPSSSYGPPKPPSSSYGPPSSSFSFPKPSSSYGPPKPPSTTYGIPNTDVSVSISSPSSSYGTPNHGGISPPIPPLAPDTTYGAPPSGTYGPPTAPAPLIGGCCGTAPPDLALQAPSAGYGAPAVQSGPPAVDYAPALQSIPSSPALDYGAPQISTAITAISTGPSLVYGTPLLPTANTDFSVPSPGGAGPELPLMQPKHPVKFRAPVPVGLISSLGAKWGNADAWGGAAHAHKYQGNTYIPPAVPDPDPGTQAHKGTALVIPPPSAPAVNYGTPDTGSGGTSADFNPPPSSGGGYDFQHPPVDDLPPPTSYQQTSTGISAGPPTGYNAPVETPAINDVPTSDYGAPIGGSPTAGGVQDIPIKGNHGTYTLHIQPAGGNPDGGGVQHHEVLSNGLLQDIIAAIENPSPQSAQQYGGSSHDPNADEIGQQLLNQLNFKGDTQIQQIPGVQYGTDLAHASSNNIATYEKPDNETVIIPRPRPFATAGNSSVKNDDLSKYLSGDKVALYFNTHHADSDEERTVDVKDVVLVQKLPDNSTVEVGGASASHPGLVSYTIESAQNATEIERLEPRNT